MRLANQIGNEKKNQSFGFAAWVGNNLHHSLSVSIHRYVDARFDVWFKSKKNDLCS